MKLLSLESSAKAASAALTEDGHLIAQYYQNCGLTHSRTLLPLTAALLENCGLRPEEVDALAVAAGPGSFTGVRIGISTVKGLALGWDRPCFAVSTLESMAQPLLPGSSLICAVMDARAGQVYNALFDWEDGLRRLCEDRAIALPQLYEELLRQKKSVILVGDGAQLCYNTWKDMPLPLTLAPEPLRMQSAYGVSLAAERQMAQGIPPCSAQELAPFYLRMPQAERERQQKLQAKGAV